MTSYHLAIDIGGSHGRGLLGECCNGSWHTKEIGTFSTSPMERDGLLYWDVFKMFDGIRSLIEQAACLVPMLDSLAIDAMGQAFALLNADGELITPPLYTRVPQQEDLRKEILAFWGEDTLYSITGLEQDKLNSLYFLAAMKRWSPKLLASTRYFLMLPDLLNYWLTGTIHNEYTIATTSNLWNIRLQCWSEEIIQYTGMTREAFGSVFTCGQAVGPLKPEFKTLPSLRDTLVIHAASHDTAAACYSLSSHLKHENTAFISAGTWGMTGCLLSSPLLTTQARVGKFANEGAGKYQIKFVNNAPCMSILEACAKQWYPNSKIPWQEIYSGLGRMLPDSGKLDLYSPCFRQQTDMPARIQRYCSDHRYPIPVTQADIARTILVSIARHFGEKYEALKNITGHDFKRIVMIGGASRSRAFVELCSKYICAPIVIGNHEASSLGNLMAQNKYYSGNATQS